ncbi:MAG: DNA polymerase IV [Eubacteriales bacterium]|nr:DNA polymerase IV [Eubacteriales bacterium]
MSEKDTFSVPKERVILHCDMNNFYASVECMLNPDLRDKAVAVCGSVEERHGIVLAKNYKAKAFGVSTGEAIWQAKMKCPNLTIVEPHYEQYMKFSKLAREIYSRYTDQIEPYGMDECWLDVTGSSMMGTGFEIADEIRRTIKFELGLTISAGVSFNKIFAKLGSDLKKPDAITCIEKETFRERIWDLPASDMLGVGRATEKALSSYGIRTIGQLAAAPDCLMQSRFGKNGLALKRYANGEDRSPVMRSDYVSPVKSIGHGTTTLQDLENDAEVWAVMLELVQDIGTKLRTHKKKAQGIAISIRNNELYSKEWQQKFGMPTQSPTHLAKTAFELFQKSYNWQHPIRSVTVRAIYLVDEDSPYQYDFFTDVRTLEKRERLDQAIESIRARFGKNAVRNGILLANSKMTSEREVELIMPSGMLG